MKLQLALAVVFLSVSTSVVHATDKGGLDILSSVSKNSVQTMSQTEAGKIRGENICIKWRILCLEFWESGTAVTETFHPTTGKLTSRIEIPTYHVAK